MSGKGHEDRHVERYQVQPEKGDHQDRKKGLEWGRDRKGVRKSESVLRQQAEGLRSTGNTNR